MSPEESRAFEADLLKDKDLHEEFQLMQTGQDIFYGEEMLDEILNDPGMKDVEEDARRMADAWIAEQESKTKVKSQKMKGGEPERGGDPGVQMTFEGEEDSKNTKHFRQVSWITLAAAGLVSAFLLIRVLLLPHITEKLYENYYAGIDPASFTMSELPPEIAGDYNSGMGYYESGDFEKALQSFERALETEGPHIEYASFYSGFCRLKLGHPKPALIAFVELPGISKHLDDSAIKLLRRANLIYTGRFREFKREVEEDGPPEAVIGPGQMTIILLVAIFLHALILGLLAFILLPILAYREVHSGNYERREEIIWKTVIVGIPYLGSIIYFLTGKKFRK